MSQYYSFFVNKNYLLFAVLATALVLPVAYVAATIQFDLIPADSQVDGDTGFTLINGTTGVDTFLNTSKRDNNPIVAETYTALDHTTFAVVVSQVENTVTVIDLGVPTDIQGGQVLTDNTELNGAHAIATYTNTNGTFAVVANEDDDSVSVINLRDPTVKINQMSNYAADGVGDSYGRAVLDGAYDVAIFLNETNGRVGEMAIVASNIDDGVQILNLRAVNGTKAGTNPEIWSLGPGTSLSEIYLGHNLTATGFIGDGCATCEKPGFRLPLDGASGVAVWYDYTGPMVSTFPDGTSTGKDAYAIVTAATDDAFQILQLTDPMNQSSATFGDQRGLMGLTPPFNTSTTISPYSNATDGVGDGGYNLLDGAMDVAIFNQTNATPYAIIVSNEDDAMIVIDLKDPTFSTGGVSAAQVFNATSADAGFGALDGANGVDTFMYEGHPYAVITSNGTSATGGFLLVDMYIPTNPLPVVDSIIDGTLDEATGNTFDELLGAREVSTFYVAPYHYAIVVNGESDGVTKEICGSQVACATGETNDDSGIQIIRLTDDVSSSSGGLICGISRDCEAPSITRHGSTPTTDGFAINGKILANQERYNDVDGVTVNVGQLVTIKARVADDYSISAIEKSILYFGMSGTPDWNTATSEIKYNLQRNEITSSGEGFSNDVSSVLVSNPYGDDPSLRMLDVSFKIMFTEPMDTSHVAIQTIDESGNYQIIYFKDALTVEGQSTGPTDTVGEEVESEVTQTIATVPDWVKNTAGWWAEGQISEVEFVKGVEFLINQQIIDTDAQTTSSTGTGASVPDWVKNTAGWWAEGQISENEFVNAIEHLIKTGTIIII